MKNFHVPLPDNAYEGLKRAAELSNVPATVVARQAIEEWLRHSARKTRHDAIAAFASQAAGTSLDLDSELEAAATEHLVKTGRKAR